MTEHVHSSFTCPAHVRGCTCPDLENHLCNPYAVNGACPDAIELMPEDEGTHQPLPLKPERIAWVVVRYETAYSTYEVDHTGPGFRVRRLTGMNEPTPKQGMDGQWKDAVAVTLVADNRLRFQWSDLGLDATITSPVQSVTPLTTEEVMAYLPEVGR